MIELIGVSKTFGDVQALAPLELRIDDGEWLGVFGRNGSGKTTLLHLLAGISRPSTGQIRIDGVEPGSREWRRYHQRLGFMPERLPVFPHLSGEKTLSYYAALKGLHHEDVRDVLEQVGLGDAGTRKTATYSKGMRQRLNLAQALLGDPGVVVVDEPIEGLDAHGARDFFALLERTAARTVVLSSHRLSLLSGVMDRICVLRAGRVEAIGTEDELHALADLPARVIVEPATEASVALTRAIHGHPTATLVSRNGRLVIDVAQEHKLALLSDLVGLKSAVRDVRIEEPSLEEVLLGID